MSLSSSLIGLRDNASCKFSARVESCFTWAEDAIVVFIVCLWQSCHQIHIIHFDRCEFASRIDFVCNLLMQLITFAFGVHTPKLFYNIPPTPNPILNQPNSVNECYKNVFVYAAVVF